MTQTDEFINAPFEVADEPGEADRRRLAIIGIGVAVLLAAAGYFLLGGGGNADDGGGLVPTHHVLKPGVVAVAPKPAAVLPPVSAVKLGRDPFHPLYVVPAAPVVTVPVAGTTGTSGSTTPGSTTPGTSGTGTTAGKPVITTYSLKLARVDGAGSNLTARFLIGKSNTSQFARAGSVFGRTAEIRLLSIQKGPGTAGTAVIQVGDGSPFDISTSDAAIFVE